METEPETEVTPEPEKETPPAPPVEHHDTSRVDALEEKVKLLEETVQSLIPQERDESPVKKPWTHRGSWS